MKLIPLDPEHGEALLQFEIDNRAWFEQFVEPRDAAFYSPNGMAVHLTEYASQRAAGSWLGFVIVDAQGALAGRANLREIVDDTGEVGYRVGRGHIGQGYASAAVAELQRIAIEERGLKHLHAFVTVANPASARVVEKNGFVKTALLRAHAHVNGGAINAWRYQYDV